MKVSSICLAIAFSTTVLGAPRSALDKRAQAVTSKKYNNLVFYWKYATSAYAARCPKPNSNTLVKAIDDKVTDTQGFIARDDTKKEIVVVFRGSESTKDYTIDLETNLVAFNSPGVKQPSGTLVHQGFSTAWNSVAADVISTVKDQLSAHPEYSIVTSGHSLGGALASLAGVSLKQNFPSIPLRLYSYGQPRAGNKVYATFVNDDVGVQNIFRSVHTNDIVPHLIPTSDGYYHHATEYWQTPDPSSAANVRKCDTSGEDPTCSASVPPADRTTAAHSLYYGISSQSYFCS